MAVSAKMGKILWTMCLLSLSPVLHPLGGGQMAEIRATRHCK